MSAPLRVMPDETNPPSPSETRGRRLRPAITYSRDAILTIDEVAAALRVSVRAVHRLDLPHFKAGGRTVRYIWGELLDHWAEEGKRRR